jgi:hypothetical protein
VRLDEAGEAAEGSTSSLRIGTAALHLTAPDATEAYVPFNLITKTHAQVCRCPSTHTLHGPFSGTIDG